MSTRTGAPNDAARAVPPDATPMQRLLLRPPRIALALLLAGALLDWWQRWPRLLDWPWRGLGVVAIGAGMWLLLSAFRRFRRVETTIYPYGRPSSLVLEGPYRFTRNPMYLGLAATMLGVGILVGTPAVLLSPVAFVAIIDRRFIPREERALEAEFGAEFRAYRARVRRWL